MAAGSLAGRTAFVTGAASGIGRAIAGAVAAQGGTVALVDIDAAAVERATDELVAGGAHAAPFVADVSDSASVQAAAAAATQTFGQVDVVFNNAGILDDFLPVLETSEELWQRVIAVNLTGMFLVAKALLPQMVERGSGVFVNTSSGAGLVGGLGGTAYTSSKHGVIGLTRQIAVDYGPSGVRAVAICPGSIDTELSRRFLVDNPAVVELVNAVPAGRQGTPEEIAALAAFLAGPDAGFITGAAFPIDGGWTTR
jgi:3-oxoacyl-[acyl-carrier protein] reductase